MSVHSVSQSTKSKNSQSLDPQDKREAIRWVVWLGRFGYAVKGVVYTIIGGLALQVAIGTGGQTTGPSGALGTIANQPFGQALLLLVGGGLFAYMSWRFVQAWVDPEQEGNGAKGIVKRIGYAISGLIYGFLGVEAVRITLGSSSGGGGSEEQAQNWTATLLAQPFGQWLVAIVGAILIGVGGYQLYRGYSAKFQSKLKQHEMSSTERTWSIRSGRVGFAARGVVYAIMGWFLIQAALTYNPEQAGGIGRALRELAQQPYGPWLLGLVALGLVAYGFFCFILARYRYIFIR